MIPDGASVTASNRLGPHISNRKEAYLYRQKKTTHYVFIDDREIKKGERELHQARLKSGELEELKRYQSFILYRTVPGKEAETQRILKEDRKKTKKPAPPPKPTDRAPKPTPDDSEETPPDPEEPPEQHE